MIELTTMSPLTELEQTVNHLLHKLDQLRQENSDLRQQLQMQHVISEQLGQKNSRAGEAIRQLISSIEGSPA